MAKAFRAGFQREAHRALPLPVGSSARVARYRHFRAACDGLYALIVPVNRFEESSDPTVARGLAGRDWDDQCERYVGFLRDYGRAPSQSASDPSERSLSSWFRHQRATLRNGLLMPERAAKLNELLPGWSSSEWLRRGWDQRLAQVADFKTSKGRWPSVASPDKDERVLATWLHRQTATRTADRDRKHAERIAKMDQLLPGWRARGAARHNERWNLRLVQVRKHWQTNGTLPVIGTAASPEEHMLGKWMAAQGQALKKGRLKPERLATLDELIPDWRAQ